MYNVNNNFMIPQIWRIFRENHIQANIIIQLQLDGPTEKWKFQFNPSDLQNVQNRVVSEDICKSIEPLDYASKYPYITTINYNQHSLKKCLDWLVANLDDDQWLFDDFRGEKSDLMDSRFNHNKYSHEKNIQCYWARSAVAIMFAKQEDSNLFKVLIENFKNDN